MKKISFFLLGLLSLLFISCGGDIKISIFTRDLSDVMNSREDVLYTNVNMIVEGLDDENDIEFLRRNLNGFSNEHKVDYNYSTSLSFDIKAPILKDGAEFDNSNYLIVITGKKDKDKTDYYLQYNQELFWRINNYIYNTHYQNIELKQFKIKLEINNDERKPVNLITYSSYVSGKSYPFTHQETLNERDRINVELSEIFGDYISSMDDEQYPIFSIE
ncbi:MAG: hypothetical protein SPK49_00985 [Erysipelotrichaceae bacterium]|nr:hypothetical protein [Erysipelotrichaceae bacterium]